MRKTFYTSLSWLVMICVGALAAGLVYYLLHLKSPVEVDVRISGTDRPDGPVAEESADPGSDMQLERFDGVASSVDGNWPQFRGPNRDGISPESIPLARKWPQNGPGVLWEINAGEGYAGAAIHNGRVYILDYDRQNQRDVVRCLSPDDGKDIWRFSYPVKVKRNHGMSRTVPAVTDRHVVTIGPKCHVTCLDAKTGEFKWMIDLVEEYGSEVPPWYAGQCPLIEDGRVILAPAGSALMLAVDCDMGNVIWQTPNQNGWQMTHSSVVPFTFDNQRMYAYCASDGVVGVASDDGRVLWQTNEWKVPIANVPSPTVIGDGLIFLSGGYNVGSAMLQLSRQNDKISAQIKFRLDPDVFGSPQHTPIFYRGYIYGVRPDKQLVCLDLNGQVLWNSSPSHQFGLGPYIIADNLIFVMNDTGVLSLAQARSDKFALLAQAKVLEGPDSWGPMAIAAGRLIVRDMNKIICLDVGSNSTE